MPTIHVTVDQLDHSSSKGQARDHTLTMDRPEPKGGQDKGPMGGEALLMGLGGCFMSNLLAAAKARAAAAKKAAEDEEARKAEEEAARKRAERQADKDAPKRVPLGVRLRSCKDGVHVESVTAGSPARARERTA